MIVYHDGVHVPLLSEAKDLNSNEWAYAVWDQLLPSDDEILTSTWTLGTGLTNGGERLSVTVNSIDGCESFQRANGVYLSFDSEGIKKVTNTITTTLNPSGRSMSFRVLVREI